MDLYGFGKTPHPSHPLTLSDYADGVRDLMTDLSVEDAVLIGHSFGGRVAMKVAAADPRVAGLILLDSAGVKPRRGVKYYIKVAAYKIGKKLRIKRLPQGSGDYRRLSHVMKGTFINVVNESSEKDASAIAVPTLLLWGKNDKDTPMYMCRRLNKLIGGSECIVLEGCGHFAYLEKANLTFQVIRAFRERV